MKLHPAACETKRLRCASDFRTGWFALTKHLMRRGPRRSNMPGLRTREMPMKHTGKALRAIAVYSAALAVLAMNVEAAPGDHPNPTDKFKSLEFREIGPATI